MACSKAKQMTRKISPAREPRWRLGGGSLLEEQAQKADLTFKFTFKLYVHRACPYAHEAGP